MIVYHVTSIEAAKEIIKTKQIGFYIDDWFDVIKDVGCHLGVPFKEFITSIRNLSDESYSGYSEISLWGDKEIAVQHARYHNTKQVKKYPCSETGEMLHRNIRTDVRRYFKKTGKEYTKDNQKYIDKVLHLDSKTVVLELEIDNKYLPRKRKGENNIKGKVALINSRIVNV